MTRLLYLRPSKAGVFLLLMLMALTSSLLPSGCGAWMRGTLQPLGWVQWGLRGTTQVAGDATVLALRPAPPPEEFDRLRRETEELRRQLAHQQLMNKELEQHVVDLSGIREELDAGAAILLADIVASDASPESQTLLIDRGATHGIRTGDWVASGSAPSPAEKDVTGRDLLLRQWLIGRVIETQPYFSRVQLASDPRFGPVEVKVARRLPDGVWQLADRRLALYGTGSDLMEIREATADYYAMGYRVVVVPLPGTTAGVLSVGQIEAARTDAQSALHYNLKVRAWGESRRLTRAFVILSGR